MNNTLTYTLNGSEDTVIITEILEYRHAHYFTESIMVKVLDSRGDSYWCFNDELTAWTL